MLNLDAETIAAGIAPLAPDTASYDVHDIAEGAVHSAVVGAAGSTAMLRNPAIIRQEAQLADAVVAILFNQLNQR